MIQNTEKWLRALSSYTSLSAIYSQFDGRQCGFIITLLTREKISTAKEEIACRDVSGTIHLT